MKNKQIISIVIIILSLGGAAVFAGMALFKSSGSTSVVETTQSTQSILPQGRTLDFSKVEEYNPNQKFFPYPRVTPEEINIPTGSLIKPE